MLAAPCEAASLRASQTRTTLRLRRLRRLRILPMRRRRCCRRSPRRRLLTPRWRKPARPCQALSSFRPCSSSSADRIGGCMRPSPSSRRAEGVNALHGFLCRCVCAFGSLLWSLSHDTTVHELRSVISSATTRNQRSVASGACAAHACMQSHPRADSPSGWRQQKMGGAATLRRRGGGRRCSAAPAKAGNRRARTRESKSLTRRALSLLCPEQLRSINFCLAGQQQTARKGNIVWFIGKCGCACARVSARGLVQPAVSKGSVIIILEHCL